MDAASHAGGGEAVGGSAGSVLASFNELHDALSGVHSAGDGAPHAASRLHRLARTLAAA